MYRSIDVWKRVSSGRVARYRCFENLETGRFSVQSCDFYNVSDPAHTASELDRQAIELLADCAPEERTASHPTLAEAVAAHDRDFDRR
jgi:hypothetical protein